MKKLLIIFTILTLMSPAYSATRYVTTNPIQSTLQNGYYNYENNKIANVEMSVFGRTYENQNLNTRLNRLERTFFNRTFPNAPIEQRINNLIVNYNNNTNITPISNSNNKWRNILDSVSSNFFGCPTGFTPPINPYYSYNPTNYGNYSDSYGTNGWRMNNQQIGSGGGIHILD